MQIPLIWFSGSGARIASHLGAACALEDIGIRAKSYGGISGGAIVATLLAIGKANKLKEDVLSIEAKDIFFPPIFNRKGKLRTIQALRGFAITRGRGLSRFSLPDTLKTEVKNQNFEGELFTFTYDQYRAETVKHVYKNGFDLEWGDTLQKGATIPVISEVMGDSDAGFERHYPYQKPHESLLFSVATEPNPAESGIDFARQLIERTAWRNKLSQTTQGIYIDLPSFNSPTEYNPEKMRDSFEAAYIVTQARINRIIESWQD